MCQLQGDSWTAQTTPAASAGAASPETPVPAEESHAAEGLADARSLVSSCLPLQEPRPEPWEMLCSGEGRREKRGCGSSHCNPLTW